MRIALLLALLVCVTGCQSKARLSRTNDALRLERESLRAEVDRLELANGELRSKLAEAEQRRSAATESELIDALPRTAGLRLTRFSGIERSGTSLSARLFVVPVDGRGRFVQTAGELTIRLISTGPAGGEPSVLAELVLEPSALRDAYVVGLTGPAYRIELPLDGSIRGPVAASVALDDLVTGLTHEAETMLSPDPDDELAEMAPADAG